MTWLAPLLVYSSLHLVTVTSFKLGFGTYTADDGKQKYYNPRECEIKIEPSALLYAAKFYEYLKTSSAGYVDTPDMNCCYNFGSREKCCRYFDTSGAAVVEKCKCDKSLKCGPSCPTGWTYIKSSGTCVTVIAADKTFAEAERTCGVDTAHLMNIKSDAIQTELQNTVLKTETSNLWIGAERMKTYYQWVASLIPVKEQAYLMWDTTKEPALPGCAAFVKADGKWKSFPCTDKLGYICQKAPPCPGTYTKDTKSETCFKMTDTSPASFDDAATACEADGAKLATVETADTTTYFTGTLLTSATTDNLWIGLRKTQSKDFAAIGESVKAPYTNFAPAEPSATPGFDCVFLKNGDWKWNAVSCDMKTKSVCEVPV